MVTVPNKTDFIDNFNIAAILPQNSPTLTDDQHGKNNCYKFVRADSEFLKSTLTPIGNGLSVYTLGGWFKAETDVGSGTNAIECQRPSVAAGSAYDLSYQPDNARLAFSYRQSGAAITSVTSSSLITVTDWNHFLIRLSLTAQTVDILFNGTEATYSVKDSVAGSPAASTFNTTPLGVSSIFNNSFLVGMDGIASRLSYWAGTLLTDDEGAQEHTNELAAIGSGFDGAFPLHKSGPLFLT